MDPYEQQMTEVDKQMADVEKRWHQAMDGLDAGSAANAKGYRYPAIVVAMGDDFSNLMDDYRRGMAEIDKKYERIMDELDARRALHGIPKDRTHEETMQMGRDLFAKLAPPGLLEKGFDTQPTSVRVAWAEIAEHLAKIEEEHARHPV